MNVKIENIISNYMDNVADSIVQDAKVNCPVRTGRLRDSIQSQKIDNNSFYIGSDVEYAIFVENGTRFMTPRAFLRRAAYNKSNYR